MQDKIENTSLLWQNIDSYKKAEFLMKHKPDCSFLAMFDGNFKESNSSECIRISNAEAIDFKKLIDFIYYNEVESLKYLSMRSLKNLLHLSNHYKIVELSSVCLKILREILHNMDDADLIRVFEYAYQVSDKDLIGKSSEIILKRAKSGLSRGHIFDANINRDNNRTVFRREAWRLSPKDLKVQSASNLPLNNLNGTPAPNTTAPFGSSATAAKSGGAKSDGIFGGTAFGAGATAAKSSAVKPSSNFGGFSFGSAQGSSAAFGATSVNASSAPTASSQGALAFASAAPLNASIANSEKAGANGDKEKEPEKRTDDDNANNKAKADLNDMFTFGLNQNVSRSHILDCLDIYDLNECIFYEFLVLLSGAIAEIDRYKLIETYAKINRLTNDENEEAKSCVSGTDADGTNALSKLSSEDNSKHDSMEHIPDINNSAAANANYNSYSQTLNMMLKSINFYDMSPKEFCGGPGKSDLLSVEEKYEILSGIINSKP